MRWKCFSSAAASNSASSPNGRGASFCLSGGVPGAILERARLFCERAGIEPARVRVRRLSVSPSSYAASMRLSSLSSSHVSSFRFTLIPPNTDLSSRSTFSTACLSMARFSARSSRLALSGLRPKCSNNQQPTAQRPVKRGLTSVSHWTLAAGC